jgi:hypothetical protein
LWSIIKLTRGKHIPLQVSFLSMENWLSLVHAEEIAIQNF